MKRTLSNLLVPLLIVTGCTNLQQKSKTAEMPEPSGITTEQFTASAPGLVEKPVMISGTVTHVCRHSGQRLFLTGEDPEQTVKITTGADIAEFDVSLEGSRITVNGILKELVIDEAYLAEWEAGLDEGMEGTEGKMDERPGEHEHAGGMATDMAPSESGSDMTGEPSAADQIRNYREKIAKSGTDHLSEYWIEAQSYSVIDD